MRNLSSPKLELALYGLLLLLGLGLRLYHLDSRPLSEAEGDLALPAWALVTEGRSLPWTEPLSVLAAAGAFFLFGDSDATARLMSALVGTALVALAWLLRPLLGRGGAWLAAFFLATSPTLVYFSRLLSSDIFAATLSLGLALCLFRFYQERRALFLYLGAAVVGLLLNTGPTGTTTLLLFAPLVIVMAWPKAGDTGPSGRGWGEGGKALGLFWLSFLAASSGLLLSLPSLGLPSLGAWSEQFRLAAQGGEPWHYHLSLVTAYEPLLLFLGGGGVLLAFFRWWKQKEVSFPLFLAFWASSAFLLLLLTGQKTPGQVLSFLVPLLLLGAALLAEAGGKFRAIKSAPFLVPGSLLILLALFLFFVATRWAQHGLGVAEGMWLAFVAAFLALLTLGLARPRTAVPWLGLGLLLLWGLPYLPHSLGSLNYSLSEGELVTRQATPPPLREALGELRLLLQETKQTAVVDARLEGVLAWYLRGEDEISYVSESESRLASIMIRPAPQGGLPGYRSARLIYSVRWVPQALTLQRLGRWLLWREPWGRQEIRELVLYVKS